MAAPLMPKAIAVWLVDNTMLTFEQVAAFCHLHDLEVQAIADDEVAIGMHGLDPVAGGELTKEEIERCEADAAARLEMAAARIPEIKSARKGARYTPVSKRQDRPDAISWLLRNYPELSDGQIGRLIGTTKPTITAIRDRTHWNSTNIKPQNPVGLELCRGDDLEKAVAFARAKAGTVHAPGAATAPDGINQVAPAQDAATQAAPAAPVEPVAAPPPPAPKPAEPDVASVFGPAPVADDAAPSEAIQEPAQETDATTKPDEPVI